MAIPASYTETDLALFMESALGKVAVALAFTAPDSYQEAVDESLLAYGVTGITQATDLRKLRALARREAWRLAASSAAAYVNQDVDGGRLDLSDLHKAIQANLARAEADALIYVGSYKVGVATVTHRDAYGSPQEDEP